MKMIQSARELDRGGRKVCLAIGVFDGVHLGHQQIIRQTLADARLHGTLAVVLTFDRHPQSIVAPDRAPLLIYSASQKMEAISQLGVDAVWQLTFNEEFSRQTAPAFIGGLVRDLGAIHSLCVGADFVFGHERSGNVERLKQMGAEWNFQVHGLAAVALDGCVVSSTRIRERIRAADFDAASQMLGRPYALRGRVIAGDRVGRQLGFPTANLEAAHLTLPPHGVYAGAARRAGQSHRAALNIGCRPTLGHPQPRLTVEAHLLDFTGDLYGSELEIEPGFKLRDERKFASRDELRQQIERDVAQVRALI